VLFTVGSWLYGIQGAAGVDDGAGLIALGAALAARLAPSAPSPGAAQLLGVSEGMKQALARARGVPDLLPADGSVQAAVLGKERWALAQFPGAVSGPVVFRRTGTNPWTSLGDAGGPGCPRLPAPIRVAFGQWPRCPSGPAAVTTPDDPEALPPDASAIRGIGMWVWYVGRAGGVRTIIAQAGTSGIRTIYVKAADGVRPWPQFAAAVGPLKRAGLRVCAWQYVYPKRPEAQAAVASAAVRAGADCFVVDAEAEFEHRRGYEGRTYRAARRYMAALRTDIGRSVPVGLTSFAYTNVHRSFPYSAFLDAPNGADALLPQVYWGAFGASVARAMARTYLWNDLYGVPVMPIGSTFQGEKPRDILRFRCLAESYGSDGASYWSWQDTRPRQWPVVGAATDCPGATLKRRRYPALAFGYHGDAVVQLQARLRAWGYPVPRTGFFRAQTRAAVRAFQRDRGLAVDGRAGNNTWAALLERPGTEPARGGLATARR
jgi:hypothetical protein